MNYIIYILFFFFSFCTFGQNDDKAFNEIYQLIDQKHSFKAREVYNLNKSYLSGNEQNFVEAILHNAFNQLETSNEKIETLIHSKASLPDSLILQLYKTKGDNSVKLYDYKEAKNVFETILANYIGLLKEDEQNDIRNSLKLWTALENKPKQEVIIHEAESLKIEKDLAGLNTLKISSGRQSFDFIFDTGANLSVTSVSVAQKLKMKVIPTDIEVGAITGNTVNAKLAVCEKMTLGKIVLKNVVFLVFDDKDLSFPEIGYQIYGILGFPVIEALNEIRITQDDYFIVPSEETKIESESNMAMDELTPLIHINGKHFSFDTGADNTMLYSKFYKEKQKEIDRLYTPTTIRFGGAGGSAEFQGYEINETFNILGKTVQLNGITLLKEKIKPDESVYGNIGQDVIKQFSSMTINFNKMFIKFD